MNVIDEIDREQMERISAQRAPIPPFQPGDTVRVGVRIKEGERSRLQSYEGICIGRRGRSINESFIVRKTSFGESVERVFPLYSPLVESIEIVRRGKVRRAKLYYLRERSGKAARIREAGLMVRHRKGS